MAEFRHLQLSAKLAQSLGYVLQSPWRIILNILTINGVGFRFTDEVSEEVLNRALQMSSKMISSSAKQDHLEKLKEQSSDPKAFTTKYLEIKENKYDDLQLMYLIHYLFCFLNTYSSEILGPYIELLSRIADDKKVKKMLKICQKEEAALNGNGKEQQSISVSSEGLSQVEYLDYKQYIFKFKIKIIPGEKQVEGHNRGIWETIAWQQKAQSREPRSPHATQWHNDWNSYFPRLV